MEIGARLKEAREAQSISLDSLQETTKIQKRYLAAIEEGNFHILPGKFYARAFIKEYATAVGLDSNELLVEYKEDLPKTEDESEVKYSRIQRTRKGSSSEKSPAIFSLIPTIIVVLLIIGIIIAAVYLYNKSASNSGSNPQGEGNDNEIIITNPNDNKGQEDTEENEKSDSADKEKSESEETEKDQFEPEFNLVESTGNTTEFDLNNAGDEVIVTMESSGNTWLEVENGEGKSFYYAAFTEDKSPLELDMTGEERIYFSMGNASDLVITINGVELEYQIDPDKQVVQKIWVNVNTETE